MFATKKSCLQIKYFQKITSCYFAKIIKPKSIKVSHKWFSIIHPDNQGEDAGGKDIINDYGNAHIKNNHTDSFQINHNGNKWDIESEIFTSSTIVEVLSKAEIIINKNQLQPNRAKLIIFKLYDIINAESFYDYIQNSERLKVLVNNSSIWPTIVKEISKVPFQLNSTEETITLLLSLTQLKCPITSDFIQEILYKQCHKHFSEFSVTDLSKFSTTFVNNEYFLLNSVLWSQFIDRLSAILRELSTSRNLYQNRDFKKLSIIIYNQRPFYSNNILKKFSNILLNYLDNKEILHLHIQTLLKCLSIFTYPGTYISSLDNEIQQLLVNKINALIPYMKTEVLGQCIQRVLVCNCDTDQIWETIKVKSAKNSNNSLQQTTDVVKLDLLYQGSMTQQMELKNEATEFGINNLSDDVYKWPKQFKKISQIIEAQLPAPDSTILDNSLLHCCKTNHLTFYDEIQLNKLYLQIRRTSNYRNPVFEKIMIEKVLENIHNYYAPNNLAQLAAFLIANSLKTTPLAILKYVLKCFHQFQPKDILALARACQVASANNLEFPQTLKLFNDLKRKIIDYDNSRGECASRINLSDLNSRLNSYRAVLNRNETYSQLNLDPLLDKYNSNSIDKQLNGKMIGVTAKTLTLQGLLLPYIANALVRRILQTTANQSAKNIYNTMWYLFETAYYPDNYENFFKFANEKLQKYSNGLNGLELIRSCLSLGFFGYLEKSTAKIIFNTNFIEKLEKEINSNKSYSVKIQNYLMQLNRVICIDYPEHNIPWFHEHFCTREINERILHMTKCSQQIFTILQQIVGGPQFCRAFHYTPYCYLIDFECFMNKNKKEFLICSDYGNVSWGSDPSSDKIHSKISTQLPSNFYRVAIDILWPQNFCPNVLQLKGKASLRRKHLEKLGYKVVQIPYFEWNSLQFCQSRAKSRYLSEKMFNELRS